MKSNYDNKQKRQQKVESSVDYRYYGTANFARIAELRNKKWLKYRKHTIRVTSKFEIASRNSVRPRVMICGRRFSLSPADFCCDRVLTYSDLPLFYPMHLLGDFSDNLLPCLQSTFTHHTAHWFLSQKYIQPDKIQIISYTHRYPYSQQPKLSDHYSLFCFLFIAFFWAYFGYECLRFRK